MWLSPILPFINDTEENISGILDMCAEAKVYGVICFGMPMVIERDTSAYRQAVKEQRDASAA